MQNALIIIPARGGSKGLPGKNIKPLNGKPLIHYTIEAALEVVAKENICVTTDDAKIIKVAEQTGIKVPFTRPPELATDTANTWDVVQHAIDWYKQQGKSYQTIILLQPTSPFRTGKHIQEAFQLLDEETDMVVSVTETKSNPYFNLFEEGDNGFIHPSKKANFTRRQDCPKIYELNGALYILNLNPQPKPSPQPKPQPQPQSQSQPQSQPQISTSTSISTSNLNLNLKSQPQISNLNLKSPWTSSRIKKYIMSQKNSVDIDDEKDFKYVEYLMRN